MPDARSDTIRVAVCACSASNYERHEADCQARAAWLRTQQDQRAALACTPMYCISDQTIEAGIALTDIDPECVSWHGHGPRITARIQTSSRRYAECLLRWYDPPEAVAYTLQHLAEQMEEASRDA
jgi:hypothetical protein